MPAPAPCGEAGIRFVPQISSRTRDWLQAGCPFSEILFGVVEDLARLVRVFEGGARVAWDDGGVVEEVEEAAAVAREEDLFLGALDHGGEVDVVGFFELLAGLFGGVGLVVLHPLVEGEGGLTMLVSWASATRFCASARTSSCSRVTSLVLCGSLYLSFWISSEILALWSLLGCTELSVLRICFRIL